MCATPQSLSHLPFFHSLNPLEILRQIREKKSSKKKKPKNVKCESENSNH
jgi:hypothetical protein